MITGTTLFVWITLGTYLKPDNHYWQMLERYAKPEYCHQAAASLGLARSVYRCVTVLGETK